MKEGLIAGFLPSESEAVRAIDRWMAPVASLFHRRLADRWKDGLSAARPEMTPTLRHRRLRGQKTLKPPWRIINHISATHRGSHAEQPQVKVDDRVEQSATTEPVMNAAPLLAESPWRD